MLDVGHLENAFSGREKRLWTEGNVQDFMREAFSESTSIESDGAKLDRAFKICNMVRIAGFQVEPTSNICDHLRFRDMNKTVEVFHHASFLMSHEQYGLHTSLPVKLLTDNYRSQTVYVSAWSC
jgi:hypothetical protein